MVTLAFENVGSIPASSEIDVLYATSVDVLCSLAFAIGMTIRNCPTNVSWASGVLSEIVNR